MCSEKVLNRCTLPLLSAAGGAALGVWGGLTTFLWAKSPTGEAVFFGLFSGSSSGFFAGLVAAVAPENGEESSCCYRTAKTAALIFSSAAVGIAAGYYSMTRLLGADTSLLESLEIEGAIALVAVAISICTIVGCFFWDGKDGDSYRSAEEQA